MRSCCVFTVMLIGLFAATSCYRFEPISYKVTLSPGLALPLANANLNIESSLVLFGAPEINLQEEVPEWAKFTKIFFIDTIPFALTDIYTHSQRIRYIHFSLALENDFPATANAQVIFLDAANHPIDSIFNVGLLYVSASALSPQGTVLRRGASQTRVFFSPERIEHLGQATQLVIRCSASNEGVSSNAFQHYLNYYLTVRLGARVGLVVNID